VDAGLIPGKAGRPTRRAMAIHLPLAGALTSRWSLLETPDRILGPLVTIGGSMHA
jgi:hypothetical protein